MTGMIITALCAVCMPLLIGDSLSSGPSQTWPATVYVRSIAKPGSTWPWWPKAIQLLTADFNGNAVWIMLGTNDSFFAVPDENYRANVDTMVDLLKELNVGRITIIGSPPIWRQGPNLDELHDRLRRYRKIEQEVCRTRRRVRCGPDLFDLIKPEHLSDGVHFNRAGAQVVHDALHSYRLRRGR